MTRFVKRLFVLSSLLLVQGLQAQRADAAVPTFKKVVVIFFENTDYDKAMAQPTFARLAAQGAQLTQMQAVAHPSQPNYVALIAGSTFGLLTDRNLDLPNRHLGDLLEEKGRSWKAYAEGFPGNCFTRPTSGAYARRHVPFLSFTNVTTNPARCSRVVGSAEFFEDFRSGTLPDFSFYTPDVKNDGHDTGVQYADRYLAATFLPLMNGPGASRDVLWIVMFDEGVANQRIYTVLYGDQVKPASRSDIRYDTFSILRTLELGFGLGDLGLQDRKAVAVDGIWGR